VSEALLNVIDNSVKYSRDQKSLRIVSGVEHAMVFVDVEDRGIGIDSEQQKKIFGKFYRVSSGLAQETRGTGLGLALVKHIMDAHNGSVTVRSNIGTGSIFRLSFPVYSNEQP